MYISFGGRVLLLKHIDMDFGKLTIMDMLDYRNEAADLLQAGAKYVQHEITPNNLTDTLAQYLGPGDLLINLAWNIEATEILQWCHDHGVLYVNTAVEEWDSYASL